MSSNPILEMFASKGGRMSVSNEATLKLLKKGDIVYVSSWLSWHYGIYKDDQTVIHLTGDRKMGCCTCQEIEPDESTLNCANCKKRIVYFVRASNFWDFVGKGTAQIVPDNGRRPLDPDVIVHMAESMKGPATYNLKFANCEHFATTCRYGFGFSTKTKTEDVVYQGTTWKVIPKQNKPSTGDFNPVDNSPLTEIPLGDQKDFDVENEEIFKSLKMGDIVLVYRPGYWHYGVYIGTESKRPGAVQDKGQEVVSHDLVKPGPSRSQGNENIIHLTGFNWPDRCSCVKLEPSPNSGGYCGKCRKKSAYFVRKSSFWDFTAEGKARIVSHDGLRPLEVDVIIRNAKSMLGPAVYDKEYANCEHFATMCRYGVGFSTQSKVCGIVYKGTSWEDVDKASGDKWD